MEVLLFPQVPSVLRELGHKELLIVFTKHDKKNPETIAKLRSEHPKLKIRSGLLITRIEDAKLKRFYDCLLAPPDRSLIESKSVDYIFEPEAASRPDFIHHRNSGLNQVILNLCKPSSKRGAKEIITSSSLLLGKRPAEKLGRMAQNARWCRKYKVKYHVTSGARSIWELRAKDDLAALHRVLLEQ